MSLFFDQAWFDARLNALGLSRLDVARTLGLNSEQVSALFKDQRELSLAEVRLLASLLAAPIDEVADRAGVSTPREASTSWQARLAAIEARLIEIRALLAGRRR
ncbi:MAG: helix-turn-helix domain-containing protein [Alphaproteobacteria bacterium]|nr:helix-turn-helix domain-containing protein [Alphaproteobacteria bacterium]